MKERQKETKQNKQKTIKKTRKKRHFVDMYLIFFSDLDLLSGNGRFQINFQKNMHLLKILQQTMLNDHICL